MPEIEPDEDPSAALNTIIKRRCPEDELLRSNERLEVLSESARLLLTSEEPEQIVQTICEKVMHHLHCHVFFNYLVMDDGERLRLNAYAGIPEKAAREIEHLEFGTSICGCVARDNSRIIAEDVQNHPDERTRLVKSFGIRAYACHPLVAQGEIIGTLSFGTCDRPLFINEDMDIMLAVSNLTATAMARKKHEESLKKKDEEIRRAYTDVIAAVTGGKLVLMTGDEIRQELGEPVTAEIPISSPSDLAPARDMIAVALKTQFQQPEILSPRAMIPFSEALTNAIKHGGGGSYQLRRLDGYIQIVIRDEGPGIDFNNLPKATLMPGFSTCGTLGLGFTIMLNESVRMLLSTRPGETFVVMEMDTLAD